MQIDQHFLLRRKRLIVHKILFGKSLLQSPTIIALDAAANGNILFSEPAECDGFQIGNGLHFDICSFAVCILRYSDDHLCLFCTAAAFLTARCRADVGIVKLDNRLQQIPIVARSHGFPKSLEKVQCRIVIDLQIALNLHSGAASFVVCEQIHCPDDLQQGKVCPMKHSSAGNGDLLAAIFAAQQISGPDLTAGGTAAMRAAESVRES